MTYKIDSIDTYLVPIDESFPALDESFSNSVLKLRSSIGVVI